MSQVSDFLVVVCIVFMSCFNILLSKVVKKKKQNKREEKLRSMRNVRKGVSSFSFFF